MSYFIITETFSLISFDFTINLSHIKQPGKGAGERRIRRSSVITWRLNSQAHDVRNKSGSRKWPGRMVDRFCIDYRRTLWKRFGSNVLPLFKLSIYLSIHARKEKKDEARCPTTGMKSSLKKEHLLDRFPCPKTMCAIIRDESFILARYTASIVPDLTGKIGQPKIPGPGGSFSGIYPCSRRGACL